MAVASLLHLAPLALTTLTLIAMMKSATHDEVYDQFRATVVPVARQAGLSVASFLCAVLVPAALGALRAGLSGDLEAQCVPDFVPEFMPTSCLLHA